jgi:hypothetical protein
MAAVKPPGATCRASSRVAARFPIVRWSAITSAPGRGRRSAVSRPAAAGSFSRARAKLI